MSGPLLYNFSDCSSPSPTRTPIARRGIYYHKVREASRSTTGTVERRVSKALSRNSGTSSASKPQSLQAKYNNENTQVRKSALYSRPSQNPGSKSLRSASLSTHGEPAETRLVDITTSVNRATLTSNAHNTGQSASSSLRSPQIQHSDENLIPGHGESSSKSFENFDQPRPVKTKGDHSFISFMKTLGFKNSVRQSKTIKTEEVQKPAVTGIAPSAAGLSSKENALSPHGDHEQHAPSNVSSSQPVLLSTRTSCVRRASSRKRRNSILRRSTDTAKLAWGFQRQSLESNRDTAQGIDEAVQYRAVQRARKLQELIQSEESYVADLKILLNVYLVLLGSTAQTPTRALAHFQQNVSDILQLHQDLLAQLTLNASPSEKCNDYLKSTAIIGPSAAKESVKSHKPGDGRVMTQALDTQEIRDFARIFDRLVRNHPLFKFVRRFPDDVR